MVGIENRFALFGHLLSLFPTLHEFLFRCDNLYLCSWLHALQHLLLVLFFYNVSEWVIDEF